MEEVSKNISPPHFTDAEYIKRLQHKNRCMKQNIYGLECKCVAYELMYTQHKHRADELEAQKTHQDVTNHNTHNYGMPPGLCVVITLASCLITMWIMSGG